MPRHAEPYIVPCSICGVVSTVPIGKRHYWKTAGRYVCSKECHKNSYAQRERMGPLEAGKARLAALRRVQNPMSDPATRAKVSEKLRARGHRPSVQGGNGRGLSEPQRLLAEALGTGWDTEVVVKTGAGRKKGGPPTHYKLDIANLEMMVAVEVDGASHGAAVRQEQDQRKTEFLTGLGWTVLRFLNREVTADTAACARTVWSTTSRLKTPTLTESALKAS